MIHALLSGANCNQLGEADFLAVPAVGQRVDHNGGQYKIAEVGWGI